MSTVSNDPAAAPLRSEKSEWRSGGRTVLFASLGFGAGPFLILGAGGIFIKPIMEATGWSLSEALVVPVMLILFAFVGLVVGPLVDTRGSKAVLMVGIVPYSVLCVLAAVLPLNKPTYYALAAGMGIFGAFAGQVPWIRTVAVWFDKGAGKAFGVVGAGVAIVSIVALPTIVWAVYTLGWRAGYLVLAAFALVIALPCALFGVQVPAVEKPVPSVAANPDVPGVGTSVTARGAFKSLRFWVFALTVLVMYGLQAAFGANMQPLLLDAGLGIAVATTVMSMGTLGSLLGRIVGGTLLDLISRYKVVVGILLFTAAGALLLTQISALPVLMVAVAVFMLSLACGRRERRHRLLRSQGLRSQGLRCPLRGVYRDVRDRHLDRPVRVQRSA